MKKNVLLAMSYDQLLGLTGTTVVKISSCPPLREGSITDSIAVKVCGLKEGQDSVKPDTSFFAAVMAVYR